MFRCKIAARWVRLLCSFVPSKSSSDWVFTGHCIGEVILLLHLWEMTMWVSHVLSNSKGLSNGEIRDSWEPMKNGLNGRILSRRDYRLCHFEIALLDLKISKLQRFSSDFRLPSLYLYKSHNTTARCNSTCANKGNCLRSLWKRSDEITARSSLAQESFHMTFHEFARWNGEGYSN